MDDKTHETTRRRRRRGRSESARRHNVREYVDCSNGDDDDDDDDDDNDDNDDDDRQTDNASSNTDFDGPILNSHRIDMMTVVFTVSSSLTIRTSKVMILGDDVHKPQFSKC